MKETFTPNELFVLRTPMYPLDYLNKKIPESDMLFFKNALYVASPELYYELSKHNFNPKDNREKETLYKYYTRACTRCTPFGLFAGCSIGYFNDKSDESLNIFTHKKSICRLDMYALNELIKKLNEIDIIKQELLYYPNNSIYQVCGYLRYFESVMLKGICRHQLSRVKNEEYITLILKQASSGKTINQLSNLIIKTYSVDENTAKEFIEQMIKAQLLISNLSIKLTEKDNLKNIINNLKLINGTQTIIHTLQELRNNLNSIDLIHNNPIDIYNNIQKDLSLLNVNCNKSQILHVDLLKKNKLSMPRNILNDISNGINFLNSISTEKKDLLLEDFINKFETRYENQEVPLLSVLDPDIGIGFGKLGIADEYDFSQYLEIYNNKSNNARESENILLEEALEKKYIKCIKENTRFINLNEEDVQQKEIKYSDLPESMNALVSIIKENGQNKIFLKGLFGHSALSVIARFCYLDKNLEKTFKKIADEEEKLLADYIVAEILYLPEIHVGNILNRPAFHKYEIPCLTQSNVRRNQQIKLSDIVVSVRDGYISLRSTSLNKYIIPRLSTAHNYSNNNIPLYEFLCHVQNQKRKVAFSFSWSEKFKNLDYFPEVRYKNIILSRQAWQISYKQIASWELAKSEKELIDISKSFRNNLKIPRYVIFSEYDNELFIDLKNPIAIKILLKYAKGRGQILLEEFIYDKGDSIIKNNEGKYCNEFIVTFYKKKTNE